MESSCLLYFVIKHKQQNGRDLYRSDLHSCEELLLWIKYASVLLLSEGKCNRGSPVPTPFGTAVPAGVVVSAGVHALEKGAPDLGVGMMFVTEGDSPTI